MSDIAGIILHNVLKNPENAAEIWPKLKLYHFDSNYSQIYISILRHYDKYNKIPNFEELKITTRDAVLLNKIRALELFPIPEDLDLSIVLEALLDNYTQEETLKELSLFLDKITQYDSSDIKRKFGEILLHLEETTDTSAEICLMNDMFVLDEHEEYNKIPLGLNNRIDARDGGTALTELLMLGGFRKSGKTVVACNITTNQYMQGNIGLFFSIEMRKREIFNRFISILAQVDSSRLRKMVSTEEELLKIAKVRSGMFVDSEEVYQDYIKHNDYKKFEIDLIKSKKLKPDNQLIIVDNQHLTLAELDMNIQKFKNMFGDKLRTVVVDYLNTMEIANKYDWQTQLSISDKFKELARKYEIVMVTPYQIDKSGEARFSRGILDKVDVAMNIEPHDKYIEFKSTAVRNIAPFEFKSPIDWTTFAMEATDAPEEVEAEVEIINDSKKKESSRDLWV